MLNVQGMTESRHRPRIGQDVGMPRLVAFCACKADRRERRMVEIDPRSAGSQTCRLRAALHGGYAVRLCPRWFTITVSGWTAGPQCRRQPRELPGRTGEARPRGRDGVDIGNQELAPVPVDEIRHGHVCI